MLEMNLEVVDRPILTGEGVFDVDRWICVRDDIRDVGSKHELSFSFVDGAAHMPCHQRLRFFTRPNYFKIFFHFKKLINAG